MSESKRAILMNPGPVTLSDGVRNALHRGDWCHREPEFADLTRDINGRLVRVYREMGCADQANQLYMVGSMGCAVSFGLGLALAQPNRPVIVLDGDGAALMRLGAQSIVGYEAPANLTHVLLDNALHESTGGQATVARSVNFPAIAAASGYASAVSIAEVADISDAISAPAASGPRFIHVPTVPGIPENLPRPMVTPAEVATRLREFLCKLLS